MIKTYIVDLTYEGIRIDKWIRNNLGNVPQSLIEKSLRAGKIKLNKKKIKSSTKLRVKDIINVYDIEFKEKILQKKIKFKPTEEIIKENENLIIDNNENFIVVNIHNDYSIHYDLICLSDTNLNCMGELTDYQVVAEISKYNRSFIYPNPMSNQLTVSLIGFDNPALFLFDLQHLLVQHRLL